MNFFNNLFQSRAEVISALLQRLKIEIFDNIGRQKNNIEKMIADSNNLIINEIGVQKSNIEKMIVASNDDIVNQVGVQKENIERSVANSSDLLLQRVEAQTQSLEKTIASSSDLLLQRAEAQTQSLEKTIASSSDLLLQRAEAQAQSLEKTIANSSELLLQRAEAQIKGLEETIVNLSEKLRAESQKNFENSQRENSESESKVIKEVGFQKEYLEKLIGASNEYIVNNIGVQKNNLENAVMNLQHDLRQRISNLHNPEINEFLFKQNEIIYKEGDKIRVYFLFQFPSFWPSIHTLYEACLGDKNIEVKVLVYIHHGNPNPQMQSAEDFLNDKGVSYEILNDDKFCSLLPHILIYQSPYDDSHRATSLWVDRIKAKGVRTVYVTYGIEIANNKRGIYDQYQLISIQNFWKIFTFSKSMKTEYLKHACRLVDNVVGIGHPKFDIVHTGVVGAVSREIQKKISNKKVVTWKIHFIKYIREEALNIDIATTPSIDIYIQFAKQLRQYSDVVFFVLPHPLFSSLIINQEDKIKVDEFMGIIEQQKNCIIITQPDYRPYLKKSDAFITDRTGMLIEMGILNKPILFMKNDKYQEELSPPVQAIVNSYEVGFSSEDMKDFVSNCLAGLDVKKKERYKALNGINLNNSKKTYGWMIKEDLVKSFLAEKNK